MFIRVRTIKSQHYYYLVEDECADGWHRQKVVGYLGRYERALATLEQFQIPAPSRQRLRDRIEQIEAKLCEKEQSNSDSRPQVYLPIPSL